MTDWEHLIKVLIRILDIEEKSLRRKSKNCMNLKSTDLLAKSEWCWGESPSIQMIHLIRLAGGVVEKTVETVFK